GFRVLSIWKAHQDMRHSQSNVAGIVAVAERFPFGVLGCVEDLCKITRIAKLCEAFQTQHVGRCSREKRGVRRGRDMGHSVEQFDVVRMFSEFVISNKTTKGASTEYAVFLF